MSAVTPSRVKPASPPAATPVAPALLQRKCACGGSPGVDGECSECRKKRLQRKARTAGLTPEVPPIVHDVLRSPGQPLDSGARAFLEPRFGHDFGRVRVHTGAKAAESVRAVNALAYTVGQDVVFGHGQYSPETPEGSRLLAHELTHVVQQRSAPKSERLTIGPEGDSAEREADALAHEVTQVTQQTVQLKAADAGSGTSVPPAGDTENGRCENGKWIFGYDGCSVPKLLTDIAGFDRNNPAGSTQLDTQLSTPEHTGACDLHDECYQTCSDDPGAREKCDEKFRADMARICFSLPREDDAAKRHCVKRSLAYYQGVKEFGRGAFRKRQEQVCSCQGMKK